MSNTDDTARRLDFIERVLRAFHSIDAPEEMWWRPGDDGNIVFYANCNDVFEWATADAEQVTPENINLFEQTIIDVKAVSSLPEDLFHVPMLFAARVREMRPQGVAYPRNTDLWPLFDACGPERELNVNNPYDRGGLSRVRRMIDCDD